MLLHEPDELFKNNTPNYRRPKIYAGRFCGPRRPCYRELECPYCWKRKASFIVKQLKFHGLRWGWDRHLVVSFCNYDLGPQMALENLSLMRKVLHPRVICKDKFISFLAVGRTEFDERWIPHFHILTTSAITKVMLKNALGSSRYIFGDQIKPRVSVQDFDCNYENLGRLGAYFMEVNIKPSLEHRPSGSRLITASRGFFTGKPRYLPEIDGRE